MRNKEKPKNRFKVPKKQWATWTVIGQLVFNKLYEDMNENHNVYLHPKGAPFVLDLNYATMTWNAAWMAADLCSRGEKYYIKELMKELGA